MKLMNIRSLKTLSATAAIMSAITMPAYAVQYGDLDDNKVVMDARGNKVLSKKFRNCVRTEWENAKDVNVCAPPKKEKVAVNKPVKRAPTPARALKKADRTVYFDFDSARISQNSKATLDGLAKALKGSYDVRSANIVGFADPIGNKQYNLNLSKQRSMAVQNYLTNRGYVKTQVANSRGLGETKNYAQCDDVQLRAERIECLQPNRRVEVEVQFIGDR